MKTTITIPCHVLRSALSGLWPFIPRKTRLPVLSRVLVERREGSLIFSATDLDAHFSYIHRLEPEPITALAKMLAAARWKAEGVTELCIPISALRDASRFLRESQIDATAVFSETQGTWPVVGGGTGCASYDEISPAEFPRYVEEGPAALPVALGATARAAMTAVVRFASKNETRYVINGVLITPGSAKQPPCVVATDGRRMRIVPVPEFAGLDGDYIIPSKVLAILQTAPFLAHEWRAGFEPAVESDDNATPPVCGHGARMRLQAGPWTLHSKLIEGNYPNYRQVIPDVGPEWLGVAVLGANHVRTQQVLRKMPHGADVMALGFSPSDGMQVAAGNKGAVLYHAGVPGISCEVRFVVAANPVFLRDMFSCGEGHLWMLDESSPLVYKDLAGGLTVTMPLRGSTLGISDPEVEQWQEKFPPGAKIAVDGMAGTVIATLRRGREVICNVHYEKDAPTVSHAVPVQAVEQAKAA